MASANEGCQAPSSVLAVPRLLHLLGGRRPPDVQQQALAALAALTGTPSGVAAIAANAAEATPRLLRLLDGEPGKPKADISTEGAEGNVGGGGPGGQACSAQAAVGAVLVPPRVCATVRSQKLTALWVLREMFGYGVSIPRGSSAAMCGAVLRMLHERLEPEVEAVERLVSSTAVQV